MTVGYNIKKLRESNKLTQPELAERIGVSASSVQKWESGEREVCQDQLVKLSLLFNVSVDYILGLKYENIDIAFYNQLGELTPEQKKDVIDYARFIRSKNGIPT